MAEATTRAGPEASQSEKLAPEMLLSLGEAAADRLPALLIAAERTAASVVHGLHGRRRAGPGESFWQFRPLGEADTPRDIDWRQSAGSDDYFVREHEWEGAQTVLFWCEGAPSMRYRSVREVPTKRARALVLAVALASLIARAGDRVGPLSGTLRPGTGRAGLRRLAGGLLEDRDALPDVGLLPASAAVVLISDFLRPVEEIDRFVKALGRREGKAHLVQVLDPAEEDWPFSGRTQFEGSAPMESLLAGRAESLRPTYRHAFGAHRDSLRDLARHAGAGFITHRTDEMPARLLMTLFTALADRSAAAPRGHG